MRPQQFFTAAALLIAIIVAPLRFAPLAPAGPDPEGNTDTFNPVTESYGLNEARRQDQIARQLQLTYQMQWNAGYGPPCPYPFEPWPRVQGDIYGYQYYQPIQQPIGHESRQTGPNRWIYRPIYPGQQPGAVVTVPDSDANQPPQADAGPELGAPNGPAPKRAVPNNAVPKRRAPADLPAPAVERPAPSDAQPGDFVPPNARLERRGKNARRAF